MGRRPCQLTRTGSPPPRPCWPNSASPWPTCNRAQRPTGLPTVAEYLPQVIAAAGPGARRTYGTYWRRMATAWARPAVGRRHRQRHRGPAAPCAATARVAAQQPRRPPRRRTAHRRRPRLLQPGHRRRPDRRPAPARPPGPQTPPPAQHPPGADRRRTRPTSTWSPAPAATTSSSTPCCCACTPRPPAAAAAPSAYAWSTSTPTGGLVRLREKGGTLRWQPITLDLAAALADHAAHRGAVLPTDTAAALPQRPTAHQPPLRPPLATHRPTPALGRRPRHLHPLATPHHPDLGRTPLRLRHRPRLRRPHRHHRTRHHHLHQSRPPRRRHRPRRHDRPTPPHGNPPTEPTPPSGTRRMVSRTMSVGLRVATTPPADDDPCLCYRAIATDNKPGHRTPTKGSDEYRRHR